jgi:hypothetical protein
MFGSSDVLGCYFVVIIIIIRTVHLPKFQRFIG